MNEGTDNAALLTAQQAAGLLGVTDAAIRTAMLEGRLPFTRMYGRKLIATADLDAYRQRTGEKPRGRPRKPDGRRGRRRGVRTGGIE